MSINVKKYTKDQMAKMVEDAQAEVQELRRVNAALTEQVSQMHGEAITRENVIANLKADADALRNKIADTEAALGRANDEVARLTVACRQIEEERDYMHQRAWIKRKLGGERNEHVSCSAAEIARAPPVKALRVI